MKNTIFALFVSLFFVSVINAGQEQYSSSKQVAQVPAACPTWSGFYIGAMGGYVRSLVDPSLDLSGGWIGFPTATTAERVVGRDLDIDGAQLGGLLGYNFQFNNFVLGLEGSAAYLWARDSRVDHFVVSSTNFYRVSSSFQTDYLATVGPRFGYAFCHFMPYVTGGAAFGNLNYAQAITFPGGGLSNRETGRQDDSSVGWFIGGGLEYALSEHWHIRGDYKYVDLGEVDFTSDFGGGGAPAHSHAELREHSATAALVFKF